MKANRYLLTLIFLLLTKVVTAGPLDGSGRLTLELEDVPLATVLTMIAQQNNLNFVLPSKLSGSVTMRLEDVDVATALDAVLAGNGYSYFLKENVIVIKDRQSYHPMELSSRAITLKYLSPATARKALASRLSDKGKVIILDGSSEDGNQSSRDFEPNRILITDLTRSLDGLVTLVMQLDVPERNLLIEAKIIELTVDTKSKLGFLWPTSVTTSFDDANGTTTGGTAGTGTTDVGSDAGIYDVDGGSWTWGKISIQQLNAVLDILEQDGNSRLVSNPRITTVENHQAVMKVETIIPIQTINRFTEGAATSDIVTFEDEEVGLSLTVTPRINEAGTITLDVYTQIEDIIGFNGPADNQKPITSSRSIRTRVTITEGESVALGGLLKESEIEKVQRVPLLGHIPLIGRLLFTNTSKETKTTDLIIFITPTILP